MTEGDQDFHCILCGKEIDFYPCQKCRSEKRIVEVTKGDSSSTSSNNQDSTTSERSGDKGGGETAKQRSDRETAGNEGESANRFSSNSQNKNPGSKNKRGTADSSRRYEEFERSKTLPFTAGDTDR